jgi:beta-galactosidase
VEFLELFADESAKAGWPLIAAAPSFKDLALNKVDGVPIWTAKPGAREAWVEAMRRELKRYRNIPSILIWGTTGNLNNHFADQDPAFLGQKEKLLAFPQWPETEKIAQEALGEIKKADPTRPAFVHAGGRLGDIFTVNHYLNILPLQEREEMLSEYVGKGDVPYIGIEFGTPLNTTMNRGRAGFGPSHESEPFLTEYAATYLGPNAYEIEPRDYRRNVRFGFTGKNWAGDWTQMQWLQSSPATFQQLQALFLKNTWRSWRTAGVTGGMIPWNDQNQIFLIRDKSKTVPAPEFQPGQVGTAPEKLKAMDANHLKPEGDWQERESAKVFREVNSPALAWIAGPAPTDSDPVAFTAKDHSFAADSQVSKSLALLNDTRTAQPYKAAWKVLIGGHEVASGEKNGDLAPAETLFVPVSFTASTNRQAVSVSTTGNGSVAGSISTSSSSSAPADAPAVQQGEIVMEATIGDKPLADRFSFRVFPQQNTPAIPPVLVFDPVGKTADMLAGLGVKTSPWDGKPSKGLLVVGREVLSKRNKLPGSLTDYVNGGGRLLVFAQSPEFFRDAMGFRVAEHVSRRVFPVAANHPALKGLDADDLRDWSARSTLVEDKPAYDPRAYPTYGWHWGNRGSVSSAMLEKPHRSGWRPILEGEFDLAYSPLMELDAGAGRAILCTLDLEDAWKSDPAARLLADQILAYAATAPLTPARKTVFLGSDADFEFLTRDLGLVAEKAATLPAAAGLAVIGPDAKITAAQLVAFARSGGNAVVLGQAKPGTPGLAGGDIVPGKSFIGSRKSPDAPAARGLGISDVRFRSDLDWPLFKESPQTFADGLLHIQDLGRGDIVQAQFEPRWFKTEPMPMFRLTRWRHTRALAQILANQGAQFAADARTLTPRARRISLAGPWKVKITAPLPNTTWDKPHTDPGISEAAKAAVRPEFDDSAWDEWQLPAWYPPLEKQNGEAVWRKTVEIPPEWEGQILQLGTARVKAFDTTFLNGQEAGSTGSNTPDAWNQPRRYRLPASLVKGGKAVIAIREFSPDFQGGVHGRPEEMFLRPVADGAKAEQLYSPDYREEFDFGDNPYRYYRW